MLQWREEAVVRELFSSVCAEIRDEVRQRNIAAGHETEWSRTVCLFIPFLSLTIYHFLSPSLSLSSSSFLSLRPHCLSAGKCSSVFSGWAGTDGHRSESHQCRQTQCRVLHQVLKGNDIIENSPSLSGPCLITDHKMIRHSVLYRSYVVLSVPSCSLTSTEVRELYWQGGIEAQESTDIVFLSQTVRSSTTVTVICETVICA